MRKFLARLVLVLALPGGAAHALLPLIPLGFGIGLVGTTSTSLILPLTVSTAAVGTLLYAVTFGGDSSNTSSDNTTLHVRLNANDPAPTPPGWTAPSGSSTEPTAPNVAQNSWTGATFNPGANNYAAPTIVCPLLSTGVPSRSTHDGLVYLKQVGSTAQPGYTYRNPCDVPNNLYMFTRTVPTCPTGYTASGGVCVATAGAVVKPSDGRCEIRRSASTFDADPNDPDCASGNIPATISGIGTNEIVAVRSPTVTEKVKINGDGTTTLTRIEANTTNNTTTTTVVNMNGVAGSAGSTIKGASVSGVSQTVQPGTGTSVGTGTLPNEGEPCGTSAKPCKIDETGTPTDAALSDAKAALEKGQADRIDAISKAGSVSSLPFSIPNFFTFSTPACENWTIDMPAGKPPIVIDICSKIDTIHTMIAFVYVMLGSLGIFFRLSSMND